MENQLCLFSFEEIINASTTGFIVCSIPADRSGSNAGESSCIFINPTAQKLTGITELTGLTEKSIFGEHTNFDGLNMSGSLDFRFEKSGIWCRITRSSLDDNFLYTLTDISVEKQNEINTSQFRKLSAEAEETMEFGSWIWDIKTSKFDWTEGMYRLMGYKSEDLISSKSDINIFRKNIHPDDVDMITEKLRNILAYTETYVLEFRIISEDGQEKHLYAKGHNTIDENTGNPISIGTAFNVSMLRDIQRELEQKVSDLNTSNSDLEQFAYVASHDLQEPLRKIVSFGERLQTRSKDSLDEENRLYLDRILSSSRRMQNMINNLLEFSKVTSSSKIFEPTDLNEILKTTLSDLEVTIQTRKATVDVDDLPVIDANPTQMSQLFLNLISNSLKFAKADTDPIISIKLADVHFAEVLQRKLSEDIRYIKIKVEDNGIGFSNENASRIFTIFQRLGGRSEYEGAGIGLSVCKKVVEGHHGIIDAFGVPDQGATFEIILPVSQY
ncbi:ATP-binding protein [Dyadobacter sp. CY345]|uniref:sensor histidine kinase n=1 Tax=Dyadobacter sp. CY345 TaxID=2909335 RepID=UPI001F1865EB|nr:PAS domain-containing sensor histidine kinase [Dyadobacter sp. CY345]